MEKPLIWFREDKYGGWNRLLNKLACHNMVYDGSAVPKAQPAITDGINDLVGKCIAEGAVLDTPYKPLSFKDLIKDLEGLGLVQPSLTPAAAKKSAQELALSASHKANVTITNI